MGGGVQNHPRNLLSQQVQGENLVPRSGKGVADQWTGSLNVGQTDPKGQVFVKKQDIEFFLRLCF
jgi:hypothetical protein